MTREDSTDQKQWYSLKWAFFNRSVSYQDWKPSKDSTQNMAHADGW